MEKNNRLIVFLELVRGCNNSDCPSWGDVCKYDGLRFMTKETLQKSIEEIRSTLEGEHPFQRVDLWAYGCGDSLEHPDMVVMLDMIKGGLGKYGVLSMAIDSRREVPSGDWYTHLDKIKIIHKQPEAFDWKYAASKWSMLPIPMSHKLITNHITEEMWWWWKNCGIAKELKAVPWHNVKLGTDNPEFIQRAKFTFDESVPVVAEAYPGLPVRRVMISWDGSLRRCLVSPTKHESIKSLILGKDDICETCFPLTGAELAKFCEDHVVVTPSASCVSDGYYSPIFDFE